MADWDGDFGICPFGVLNSFTAQNCLDNWGVLDRIAFAKKNADLTGINATTIITEAQWTTMLADPDPDKWYITPAGRVFDYVKTPGEIITETKPANGRRIPVRQDPSALAVTFDSLTSANREALMLGNLAQEMYWYYITAGGIVIGAPSGLPFKSTMTMVQDNSINASQSDKNILTIEHYAQHTLNYDRYDASAFILTIV